MRHTPTSNSTGEPLKLADNASYVAAKNKLDEMDKQVFETTRRREGQKNVRGRVGPDAERWLANSPASLPNMTDQVFDEITTKIIAAGGIPTVLMMRLRSQMQQIRFADPNDAEIVEEIQQTEAALLLFKRAVVVQEREVHKQKNIAIAEICTSVRPVREKIAQRVVSALADLVIALKEEHQLIEGLRLQDLSISELLSPRPFPIELLADPRLLEWLQLSAQGKAVDARTLLAAILPGETTHSQGAAGR